MSDSAQLNSILRGPLADWRLQHQLPPSLIAEIEHRIEHHESIPVAQLLKRATRRLIFRIPMQEGELLVKAFPLGGLKKRLQHEKYADAEMKNLFEAHRRGLPVPMVLGFGRRRRFGLVAWNALLTEFVVLPSLEQRLDAESNVATRRRLIDGVFPYFRQLFEAGCNHIDFKPGSLLGDHEGGGRIIDFQYATFLDQPSPQVLASQAGHFAWDVAQKNNWLPEEDLRSWFDELVEFLGIGSAQGIRDIFLRTSQRRYSIDQRLRGVAGID